jgi:hypothetical protein
MNNLGLRLTGGVGLSSDYIAIYTEITATLDATVITASVAEYYDVKRYRECEFVSLITEYESVL